jgi:hypothetical protein
MDPATCYIEKVEGELPKRESVTRKETNTDQRPFVDKTLSKSATLGDLSKEFVFFTHSALFVYGNWTKDPVSDYIETEDKNCSPFWVTFDGPVFSGLDFQTTKKRHNREWNYRLMGCPIDTWPGLLKFLQTLSGVNKAEHRFHITVVQKIPMLDYFAMAKKSTLPGKLPMVDLYTVGLLGNDRSVYFEPAKNPPLDKVRIRIGPPIPQIVAQGESVLAGNVQQLSSPILIPMEERNDQSEVLARVGS